MKRFLSVCAVVAGSWAVQAAEKAGFQGGDGSWPVDAISFGVEVPSSGSCYFTSGIPPIRKTGSSEGNPFGDTKAQGEQVLRYIESNLGRAGLSLADVLALRVYVAPDKRKNDVPDFNGWFDAYAEFFNTPKNPVKPIRSTVGVAALINPDWLIEIEVVALRRK